MFNKAQSCLVPVLAAAVLSAATSALAALSEPKNVIIFHGDGMALEHAKLTSVYNTAANGNLTFQKTSIFPHQATMTTNAYGGALTDSAAAGTAMATGVKVNNGVISQRTPGDNADLPTILEVLKSRGKSTGVITVGTELVDASPAAYTAHTSSRYNSADIFADMMNGSQPNVLFGRTSGAISEATATGKGYTIARNATDVTNLSGSTSRVLGHWSSANEPGMPLLTTKALDILDNDPDGFFLFVENEEIDEGAHANSRTRVVNAVNALNSAIDAALAWKGSRNDTLIIVLGDHETGGLTVGPGPYTAGVLPAVTWGSGGHTSAPVGVYALGPNSELISGQIDNTQIFAIATAVPEPAVVGLLAVASTSLLFRKRRVA